MRIIVVFLSSIVLAVLPCLAKGNSDDGLDRYLNTGISCSSNDMADYIIFFPIRCNDAYSSFSGLVSKKETLKKEPPVPFLINISTLLAKTRWAFEDTYFRPARTERDVQKQELGMYIMPVVLVIIALAGILYAMQGWQPNRDPDNDLSV